MYVVYPVLEYERVKRGITKAAICRKIGISERCFYNKMRGASDFSWQQICDIQRTFFPDLSKEELLKRKIHDT